MNPVNARFFACGKEHMHLIVCLDDENGMAFLGRRQSRDRLLPGDIAAHCEGPLYALPYSLPLLKEAGLTAVAAAPSEVPENGIFFDELLPPSGFIERADFVTVYRWNRLYPADVYFDADLAAASCGKGSAAAPITMQITIRIKEKQNDLFPEKNT